MTVGGSQNEMRSWICSISISWELEAGWHSGPFLDLVEEKPAGYVLTNTTEDSNAPSVWDSPADSHLLIYPHRFPVQAPGVKSERLLWYVTSTAVLKSQSD